MTQMIYVVEDDESIRELIRMALVAFSYEAQLFETAEELLMRCKVQLPDLILCDIMLPGISGIDAVKELRGHHKTANLPIIMLTAKSTESDKVIGLDAGADDYVAKPFGVMELMARIRALLRRSGAAATTENSEEYVVGDLNLSVQRHELHKNGNLIELTYKEFELLHLLMKERGKVLTREKLLNMIWGYDFTGETRTLDMHIRSLRQKIGDDAENPLYITTVRGIGYKLK